MYIYMYTGIYQEKYILFIILIPLVCYMFIYVDDYAYRDIDITHK